MKEAENSYTKAHRTAVDDVWTLVRLARVMSRLGECRLANRFLTFATRVEPRNADVLALRTELVGSKENLKETRAGIRYTGDKKVLEYALKDLGTPPLSRSAGTLLEMAWAYDIYGLPNGEANPTHARRVGHMTQAPESWKILRAYWQVVNPLLSSSEKLLHDIPIGFVENPAVEAFCYTSESGRCAIAIFAGLFAGLFAANERAEIVSEELRDHGKSSITPSNFVDLLDRFLLGSDTAQHELLYEFSSNNFVNPERAHEIWRNTSIQQVFLLLHEYGHLYCDREPSFETRGQGIFRRRFSGRADEFEADLWAARHIANGIPGLDILDPLQSDGAVFRLFAFLELLRKHKRYDPGDHPLPVDRWLNVAPVFNPMWHDSGIFEAYEKRVRRIFEDIERFFYRPSGN
jgi:hypothetical protein